MSLKYLVSSTVTSNEVKKVNCKTTEKSKVNAIFINENYMHSGKTFWEEEFDF